MLFLTLFQIEYQVRKRAEGKKARDDKDAVLNMLFAAFEKHQYYNIKDLQKVTDYSTYPPLCYFNNGVFSYWFYIILDNKAAHYIFEGNT